MAPDPRLVVDYEKLIGRLTERACRVLGVVRAVASTHVVDGLGKSPEDLPGRGHSLRDGQTAVQRG